MIRSVWKLPFSKIDLFFKIFSSSNSNNVILVSCRNSLILPIFVGYTFLIHNGQKVISLQIHSFMIGYKFGKFVFTRKKYIS